MTKMYPTRTGKMVDVSKTYKVEGGLEGWEPAIRDGKVVAVRVFIPIGD